MEIAANEPAPRAAPPMGTPLQKEDDGRPSTDENMGRGFQGVIEWKVVTPKGAPRGLRYLARGNDARLQIDGQNGHGAFDALIWGENMSVIDNEQHTFRTVPLDQVPVSGKDDDVRVMKTGERRMLQGVLVERYEIDDEPLHVSAWVTGLPGTFSTEKFEQVSGHDVPAWAQHLLDEEMLPLEASARDASAREVYRVELLRYAGGPVDESSLALPENYTPTDDSTGAKPPSSTR